MKEKVMVNVHLDGKEQTTEEFLKAHNIMPLSQLAKMLEKFRIISTTKKRMHDLTITELLLERI